MIVQGALAQAGQPVDSFLEGTVHSDVRALWDNWRTARPNGFRTLFGLPILPLAIIKTSSQCLANFEKT